VSMEESVDVKSETVEGRSVGNTQRYPVFALKGNGEGDI